MTLSANQLLYPLIVTTDQQAAPRPATEFLQCRPADNSDPASLLPSRVDFLAGAVSFSGLGATSGQVFVLGSNGLMVPRYLVPSDITAPSGDGKFISGSRSVVNLISLFIGGQFWTAPQACQVVGCIEVHADAADSADTATLEKLSSAAAPGSGTTVLAGNFALNSTVNVPVSVNGHATLATRSLAIGQSLAFKYVSGDGTGYTGAFSVIIEWI